MTPSKRCRACASSSRVIASSRCQHRSCFANAPCARFTGRERTVSSSSAQRFFVGKRAHRPAIHQDTINRLMIRAARKGRRVVRLPELATARHAGGLAREMGRQLARIHAVPLARELGFLPAPAPGRTPAEEALAATRRAMDALGRDNPVWEYGLRWLSRRAPVPPPGAPHTLVHGDFRVGNLLDTPEGVLPLSRMLPQAFGPDHLTK